MTVIEFLIIHTKMFCRLFAEGGVPSIREQDASDIEEQRSDWGFWHGSFLSVNGLLRKPGCVRTVDSGADDAAFAGFDEGDEVLEVGGVGQVFAHGFDRLLDIHF